MSDQFHEMILPVAPKGSDTVKKVLMILATVILLVLGVLSPIFFILFAVMCLVDYFIFPRFKKEYEYSYVNGDIDIAVIYSKQSRKDKLNIPFESIECVAPVGSHHLDSYGTTFERVDYTTGTSDEKSYAVVTGGEKNRIVLLHLSEEMFADLRYRAPRKVFQD